MTSRTIDGYGLGTIIYTNSSVTLSEYAALSFSCTCCPFDCTSCFRSLRLRSCNTHWHSNTQKHCSSPLCSKPTAQPESNVLMTILIQAKLRWSRRKVQLTRARSRIRILVLCWLIPQQPITNKSTPQTPRQTSSRLEPAHTNKYRINPLTEHSIPNLK